MSDLSDEQVIIAVGNAFTNSNVPVEGVSVRRFPGETIVVVEVFEDRFADALRVAASLDETIPEGFISVRKVARSTLPAKRVRAANLLDPRVNSLIELLSARSRTSEQNPSLRYVPDATQSVSLAMSERHQLIFGRRGVGKTALMLEARKQVENRGAVCFWMNIQPMRELTAVEAFLSIASRLCDLPAKVHASRKRPPASVDKWLVLKDRIGSALTSHDAAKAAVALLIPDIHAQFNILSQEIQAPVYIFIDDFHYLPVKEQPAFLDRLNSISRDNRIWLKAASIKHQSRWFTDNPPTGLQTGHDAEIINLDVTLESPAKARDFLLNVLRSYTDEANLPGVHGTISSLAIDRLVLASGGVPRDFLFLTAQAIQVARQRLKAKTVGGQDVNEAAGRIAQIKMQELEDDAASSIGQAQARRDALVAVRKFLLEEKKITFCRVDFQDKESKATEYELLQSLMDLRLLHLINAALSDEREAGHRSEVYMLDLSQFSGMRFRRNLRVLDLVKDHLELRAGAGNEPPRLGNTPKKLLGILRRGPLFQLSNLSVTPPKKTG